MKEEGPLLRKDISSSSFSNSSYVGGLPVLIKGKEGKGKGKTDDDEVKQKNENGVVVGKKQNGNGKPEVEVADTNLNSGMFGDKHDDEVLGGDENGGSSLFVVVLEMARRSCSAMDPLNFGLYSLEV
ncbi:unnamed protein product [Ilex paraguariensis]|uniref:Uncharacterized protein n=1 Tax=Ilex paraguariensis TaxID=185542 RepID=A0ABC8RGD5_9AQUA